MIVQVSVRDRHKARIHAEFRRQLEETRGIYRIEKTQHRCWLGADDGLLVTQHASPDLIFYGCLDCGRTHWCNLATSAAGLCPRAPGSAPGEYVCPFSGRCLDVAGAQLAVLGSFHQQNHVFDSLREARALTDRDHAFLSGPRTGSKEARSLAWQRKFTQADVAAAGGRSRGQMRLYERLGKTHAEFQQAATAATAAQVVKKDDRRMPWQIPSSERLGVFYEGNTDGGEPINKTDGPVADNNDDDDPSPEQDAMAIDEPSSGAAGDDEDAPSTTTLRAPEWNSQPLYVPQAEIQRDKVYLVEWLDPVFAYLAKSEPSWDSDGAFPEPAHEHVMATRQTNQRPLQGYAGDPESTAFRWPLLTRATSLRDYLPHQIEMLQYTRAFVSHFAAALAQKVKEEKEGAEEEEEEEETIPVPLECEEYVRMCDTLLLLYATYHPQPSPMYAPDQEPRVVRLMFVMLTYVFPSNTYKRDSVTGVHVPIWLRDPWLAACRAKYLFRDPQLLPATLAPSGANGAGTTFNSTPIGNTLLDCLDCTPYSAHSLYHLFHPPREIQ